MRPRGPGDDGWIERLLRDNWGSTVVISRGRAHDATSLPGFVALIDGRAAGLATYRIEGSDCELVTLDSLDEGRGVGTALIDAVKAAAKQQRCGRLWLITTNDNTHALRFYQRRGFRIVAVHVGAIAESRRLKPEIPELGQDGIPIRDEIELALELA